MKGITKVKTFSCYSGQLAAVPCHCSIREDEGRGARTLSPSFLTLTACFSLVSSTPSLTRRAYTLTSPFRSNDTSACPSGASKMAARLTGVRPNWLTKVSGPQLASEQPGNRPTESGAGSGHSILYSQTWGGYRRLSSVLRPEGSRRERMNYNSSCNLIALRHETEES